MSIVSNYQLGQLLTMTQARRQKKISDIAYNATPLLRILRDERRIRRDTAGGPELRLPVEFDKLPAIWYRGYDIIPMAPRELVNSAVFDWAHIVSPYTISGTEIMYNRSPEQIIQMANHYQESAEKSVREGLEEGLISDGTADGGRQIIGLNGAVSTLPATGIYGGINRADVLNWRTTYYDVTNGDVPGFTAWDATSARAIIDYVTLARSRGSNYPDLWICDALSYRAISSAVMAVQVGAADPGAGQWGRSSRAARLGFESISLMTAAGTVDIVAAGGVGTVMPANTIFGIDTKSMALYEFPDEAFVPFHPGNGVRAMNQDAFAQGIKWSGQLVLENPRFTVRLKTA